MPTLIVIFAAALASAASAQESPLQGDPRSTQGAYLQGAYLRDRYVQGTHVQQSLEVRVTDPAPLSLADPLARSLSIEPSIETGDCFASPVSINSSLASTSTPGDLVQFAELRIELRKHASRVVSVAAATPGMSEFTPCVYNELIGRDPAKPSAPVPYLPVTSVE